LLLLFYNTKERLIILDTQKNWKEWSNFTVSYDDLKEALKYYKVSGKNGVYNVFGINSGMYARIDKNHDTIHMHSAPSHAWPSKDWWHMQYMFFTIVNASKDMLSEFTHKEPDFWGYNYYSDSEKNFYPNDKNVKSYIDGMPSELWESFFDYMSKDKE
jgi:hypothetical protein